MFNLGGWPSGGEDPILEYLQQTYVPSLRSANIPGLLADSALGNIAVVSSFGAESAVLLHFVQDCRPGVPVIFLDTGKHFEETLAYRDRLAKELDLNLVTVKPDDRLLGNEDPTGLLCKSDPNACCTLRKVFPLQDVLSGFDSWISGRKRYQGAARSTLPILERDGEKIKVNPLATWAREDVSAYFERRALPRHPLEALGYRSIGCAPCTRPVAAHEAERDGRWAQMPDKTECGIHLGPDGRFRRSNSSD